MGDDQTHSVFEISTAAECGWDQRTAPMGLPEFPQDAPDDACWSVARARTGLAVAQQSAGHSNRAVTLGHYVSGDVQERMVAAAIDMMPSPVPPRVVADREFID
jgi:hypothetical protein